MITGSPKTFQYSFYRNNFILSVILHVAVMHSHPYHCIPWKLCVPFANLILKISIWQWKAWEESWSTTCHGHLISCLVLLLGVGEKFYWWLVLKKYAFGTVKIFFWLTLDASINIILYQHHRRSKEAFPTINNTHQHKNNLRSFHTKRKSLKMRPIIFNPYWMESSDLYISLQGPKGVETGPALCIDGDL